MIIVIILALLALYFGIRAFKRFSEVNTIKLDIEVTQPKKKEEIRQKLRAKNHEVAAYLFDQEKKEFQLIIK